MLTQRFGKAFKELPPEGKVVLATAFSEKSADHARLLQLVEMHSRDLTLLLQKLVRNRMLVQDRPGRGCSYGLPEEMPRPEREVQLDLGYPEPVKTRSTGPTAEVAAEVTAEVTAEVRRLLEAFNGEMSRREIQTKLALKHDEHFRKHYLLPALRAGFIEMAIPDKPKSRLQKYRLTQLGQQFRR